MPREVMVEFTAPEELTGVPVGTKSLRYSVDADEFVAKGLGRVVDEFPAPRSWLLDKYGAVPIGVMSSNQAKQTPAEREAEQRFLKDQIKALDQRHEAEAAERQRKDSIEKVKKETSRG